MPEDIFPLDLHCNSTFKKYYFLLLFLLPIPQKCLAAPGSWGLCINLNCRWLYEEWLQYSGFLIYWRVSWQGYGHIPDDLKKWTKQFSKEYNYLASLILYLTLPTIPSPFTEQWPWRSSHVNKQHISPGSILTERREKRGWLAYFSQLQKAAVTGFWCSPVLLWMWSSLNTHFGTWFSIFMTLWEEVIKYSLLHFRNYQCQQQWLQTFL